jgi:hypothetical protein
MNIFIFLNMIDYYQMKLQIKFTIKIKYNSFTIIKFSS